MPLRGQLSTDQELQQISEHVSLKSPVMIFSRDLGETSCRMMTKSTYFLFTLSNVSTTNFHCYIHVKHLTELCQIYLSKLFRRDTDKTSFIVRKNGPKS